MKENKVKTYLKKNYKTIIIYILSFVCVVGFSGLTYATVKVHQENQQLKDIIKDMANEKPKNEIVS